MFNVAADVIIILTCKQAAASMERIIKNQQDGGWSIIMQVSLFLNLHV